MDRRAMAAPGDNNNPSLATLLSPCHRPLDITCLMVDADRSLLLAAGRAGLYSIPLCVFARARVCEWHLCWRSCTHLSVCSVYRCRPAHSSTTFPGLPEDGAAADTRQGSGDRGRSSLGRECACGGCWGRVQFCAAGGSEQQRLRPGCRVHSTGCGGANGWRAGRLQRVRRHAAEASTRPHAPRGQSEARAIAAAAQPGGERPEPRLLGVSCHFVYLSKKTTQASGRPKLPATLHSFCLLGDDSLVLLG